MRRPTEPLPQNTPPLAGANPDSTPWVVTPPAENWLTSLSGFRVFLGISILFALLILLGYIFWEREVIPNSQAGQNSIFTPMPQAVATPTPAVATPTPLAALVIPTMPVAGRPEANEPLQLTLPAPPPGGGMIALTPEADQVGWTSSLDGQSHFNDPNIHVGFFNGQVYHGAIQFDLSSLPPGARIVYAALELVGLSDQNLTTGGAWQVQLLKPAIDPTWPGLQHDKLRQAETQISILPSLASTDLGRGRVNILPLGPEQLVALEQHVAGGAVSFRLDGPEAGSDNLFSWDSGLNGEEEVQQKLAQDPTYREQFTAAEWVRLSRKPILWIVTDHVQYVAITPSPTPENVFTAAAMAATITAEAEAIGTATPLPAHWATPIVVTVPPPPANQATADFQAHLATAEAVAFGTATPTPLNVWTATPTAQHVYITSTPTPENVITEAAMAVEATHMAETVGTYTPVPGNWATPYVVTPLPEPGNAATAEFHRQIVTAEAFLYGMVWTATPTPVQIEATPLPTFTPTPGYISVPAELVNKIAFLSDRAGLKETNGQKEPPVFVMNPDGSEVTLMSDRAAYDAALARDSFSADQRYRAYVTEFLRFDGGRVPGIYFYDYLYGTAEQLTRFGSGLAYDPVWSPTQEQLAFVATENGNDEIWVMNRDGSDLRQLTNDPNWDKHPSWSPDGSQIIFWSNRSGQAQIWIINADGSDPHILAPGPFNDWNPVWIKYADQPSAVPVPTPTTIPPYLKYK